eukprot:CAMPEP_0174270548 /NCGR_PEP_ID=MMETSP0439-20130205/44853_1 /TAXON_ID=0 /ORGANISM="Stereomyxa ramosa, Strain Chinc5" /LENGTH=82 /DNA_ID=CAMNT_0015359937 /DNA_START=50 /DNA_END=295 /DNA_ORIENTATION=+
MDVVEARQVQVLLYCGPGAGGAGIPALTTICEEHSAAVTKVTKLPEELDTASWDVVIFPGGTGSIQHGSLGEKGGEQVRKFV